MDFTEAALAGALEAIRIDALNENTDLDRMSAAAIACRVTRFLRGVHGDSVIAEPGGELDRAYVINGDDLRIALSRWYPTDPREGAAHILRRIEATGATVVSERSLAEALDAFYVNVRTATGKITAKIADAGETAKAILAALSRTAALREPDNDVVDAHICCEHAESVDRELCAMTDIVLAMSCAEIEPYAVVRALYPLDGTELHRVLRWFLARYPGPA